MWQFQPMATYNHTSCYATYNSLAGLWYLIALSFPYIPTCIQLLGQNQIGCIFHVTTIQKMEKMIPLKLYDISGYIFFLFNSLNWNYDCINLSVRICISSPLFIIAWGIKMCAYKLIEWILRWIPYSVRKKKNTLWHNVALWNVWNLTQLETNNPLEYVWCYVLVIFSSSTKVPYYSCIKR